MRLAMTISWIAFAALAAVVTYGFLYGTGWVEVRQIWALAWGKVSFADVYAGFILFSLWLIYRERSPVTSAVWIVLIMTLGNVISCLYVAIALGRSRGNWQHFWNGSRS